VNHKVPVWAVIPAAGIGRRMQRDVPKQYLEFHGKSVIQHCLERLMSHPAIEGAIVVLRDDDEYWDALEIPAGKPLFTTRGGAARHHSVYSGLTTLQYRVGNDVIALVHDAVRPLVSHADLDRVIDAARTQAAGAILATPVTDTLKLGNEEQEIIRTVGREGLWRALTPQVFHLQALLNALQAAIDQGLDITDEAMALELQGHAPMLVAGSPQNIKITQPEDLRLAESIWSDQRDQHQDE